MHSYIVRMIGTRAFYGFNNNKNNETKVVYFTTKRDAEKFASFLSCYIKSYKKVPEVWEYDITYESIKYQDKFELYKIEDKCLKYMLGMHNLGYHECMIVDNNILCLDSGIYDVEEQIKIDGLEKLVYTNDEYLY